MYYAKYFDATTLAKLIEQVGIMRADDSLELDGVDTVRADNGMNALVFFCTPISQKHIEAVLAQYDCPAGEALFHYTIYEIDSENDGNLGVDFQAWKNGPGLDLFAAGATYLNGWDPLIGTIGNATEMVKDAHVNYINFNPKWNSKYLDFLVSKSKAKVLTSGTLDVWNKAVGTIESVTRANALAAKQHGHALVYTPPESLPLIVGDRSRLEQVMMNVIGNAIKYTPDGGHISITAGCTEDQVWMEVCDDGIGIPEKDRERIFDRFYRVDKARSRESGGTGLGLSIAKEIVQRHHGSIALAPHEGPGTTVRLTLPIGPQSHPEYRDRPAVGLSGAPVRPAPAVQSGHPGGLPLPGSADGHPAGRHPHGAAGVPRSGAGGPHRLLRPVWQPGLHHQQRWVRCPGPAGGSELCTGPCPCVGRQLPCGPVRRFHLL